MLKRLMILMLVLVLGLSSIPALGEEEAKAETVAQLDRMVREYLDNEDYKFTYDSDQVKYSLDFELEGVLKSCVVEVYVFYDAIYVSATPDLSVPNKNLENLAIAATLANNHVFYSQFGVDFSNNTFHARAVQLVEKTLPGYEELDILFHMPMFDLEDYGDAFYAVSQEGADPYDEVAKVD